MNATTLYIEIGQSSLKVLYGEAGLELSVERTANGRLTDSCRQQLIAGLQNFLKRQSWQPRLRALCAVNARGVSLRRMTIPSASKEESQRLLELQIEAEFPLTPEELAWGCRELSGKERSPGVAVGRQELLVIAVKKEVVEVYSEIFAQAGLKPVFALAAMARNYVCPKPAGTHALLDIGRNHSELIAFENGVPVSVRILSWGGESLTRAIQEKLAISHEAAEKIKINLDQGPATMGERDQMIQSAMEGAFDSLATCIRTNWTGQKLYLAGKSARLKDTAARLAKALGGADCERLALMPGEGRSAATLGLEKSDAQENDGGLVVLRLKEAKSGDFVSQPALRKWAAVAALLLLGVILFPYAEAVLLKTRLAKKIADVKAAKGRLSTIDRELAFLQDLRKNQPPYLEAMYLVASAAPGGTRIDSLSMNRLGEVSLRGNMRDSTQVAQFRSKLIDSGFFANVVVEEQTPTPDRQKLMLRMSAQWKPANARELIKLGPSPEEIEKIKAAAKEFQPASPPMMGAMPMDMGGAFPAAPAMAASPGPTPPVRSPPGSRPGRIVPIPGMPVTGSP